MKPFYSLADTDKEYQATAYGNLGLVHETKGDLTKAIEFYEKALALYTEIGAVREIELVQSWLDAVDKTELSTAQ